MDQAFWAWGYSCRTKSWILRVQKPQRRVGKCVCPKTKTCTSESSARSASGPPTPAVLTAIPDSCPREGSRFTSDSCFLGQVSVGGLWGDNQHEADPAGISRSVLFAQDCQVSSTGLESWLPPFPRFSLNLHFIITTVMHVGESKSNSQLKLENYARLLK